MSRDTGTGRQADPERQALAELRRARLRSDELNVALRQKEEQFLGMLGRLQEREEQAVRRALELAERTREAEAARARAEAAEERLRSVLAEAGRLAGASLDYRASLASIARLAAPELADWCIIDVLDEQGEVERAAVVSGDPACASLAGELAEGCADNTDFGVHQLVERGRMSEGVRVDDRLLRALACGQAQLARLRGLGLTSALVVPMLARGRLLGGMALLSGSDRPPPGKGELLLAGELAGRAAVAVDNARLYDAALAGSRSKSEFLAVVSHELRTPLNAIIGFTDLLRAEVAGAVNAKQEAQLERIRSSADHLLALIEEILTFSRLEAGRAEVQAEELDAAKLAKEVATLMEPLAARKELELRVLGAERPVPMHSDPRKLRQVLLNLLSNAIKFTDEGEVELTLEGAERRVRWHVRDTGIGIPESEWERIFTPFSQVEQSTTRRSEGTGLGLSVSRGLARLLGGELRMRSRPGAGSTFTLDLPARAPDIDTVRAEENA